MCKAFCKALALSKVGYNCAHKLYGEAQKKGDAHTVAFLECCIGEAVQSSCCSLLHDKSLKRRLLLACT